MKVLVSLVGKERRCGRGGEVARLAKEEQLRFVFVQVETLAHVVFGDLASSNAVVELDVVIDTCKLFESSNTAGSLVDFFFVEEFAEAFLAFGAVVAFLVAEEVFDMLFGARGLHLVEPRFDGSAFLRG